MYVIIIATTTAFKEMGYLTENIEITDTASSVLDEDTNPLEDLPQHLDVKNWMGVCQKTTVFDLHEIMDVIGVKSYYTQFHVHCKTTD